MKKILLLAIISLFMVGPVMAGLNGGAYPVSKGDGSSATITVVSDQSIYTESFPLNKSDTFGIWFKAVSTTGTPALKIELEQSYARPSTEGSGNGNWVEADNASDVITALTDEVAHVRVLSPAPMPFGRYKITGTGANPADTTITIYNFTQGNI